MGIGEKHPLVNPGRAIGVALVCGGVLLFLNNLGIFEFDVRSLFWPIILLIYGGSFLYGSRSPTNRIWGWTAVAAGFLLMLDRFHILGIHVSANAVWPLVLIAAGVIMLISRMPGGPVAFGGGASGNSGDTLQEFAIFSGVKRKVQSQNFEGGQLSTTFGGIEIDLRRADISSPTREAVIEANAMFGGIEIRVPETWRVSLQGTAVFGGYEDKTLPPRPEPGVVAPLLIVRGGTAFGGVSIQN